MMMTHDSGQTAWIELDRRVEAFERDHRQNGTAGIDDHLTEPASPLYLPLLRELVRSDLELRWSHGDAVSLEEYRGRYPALFQEPESVEQIALEEYRLRKQAGEHVRAADYAVRYGIDVSTWCVAEVGQEEAAEQVGSRPHFPEAGTHWEGFDLIEELGRGAFSRVFLASQDELAGRPVALKVSPHLFAEPWQLARLQHGNIVPIYSLHQRGAMRAVCMPFWGRTTLADLIHRLHELRSSRASGAELVAAIDATAAAVNPAPMRDQWARLSFEHAAVSIAEALADGLAHAHERGILHRDLKPANVLIADDGTPMLLDFNLSEQTADGPERPTLLGGTPAYMAPEQIRALQTGEGAFDPRSDLYSLGLVIRELLTGEGPTTPPTGGSEHALDFYLKERESRRPSIPRGRGTRAVAAIIEHCLEPNPEYRYPSARALQEDLKRELENRPLRYAANHSLRERAIKWTRRHPRALATGLVGAVAASVIAGLWMLYSAQGARLGRVLAIDEIRQFRDDLETCRTLLSVPEPRSVDLAVARQAGTRALDRLTPSGLAAGVNPAALEEAQGGAFRAELGELHFLLARGAWLEATESRSDAERASRLEEALRHNDRARHARAADGGSRAVLQQRAFLERLAGRPERAVPIEEAAQKAPLRGSRDRLLLAMAYLEQEEPARALPLLEEVLESEPRDAVAWFVRGVCQNDLNEPARAEASLTASLALRPDNPWAHHFRGISHLSRGEWALAEQECDAALQGQASFLPALVNRALARFQGGNPTAALDDLDHAITQPDAPTRLYFLRAQVRDQAGDTEGAQRDREQGLQRQPNDEASWVARGVAHLADNPDAALDDFEAALRINPASRDAMQNMAHVLSERLSKPHAGVAVLDRAITIHPRHAPLWAGRAVLQARLGERSEAIDGINTALELGASPEIGYQAACVWAQTSRIQPDDRRMALDHLTAALQAGYGHDLLHTDLDLDPLGIDPEFQRLRDQFGAKPQTGG